MSDKYVPLSEGKGGEISDNYFIYLTNYTFDCTPLEVLATNSDCTSLKMLTWPEAMDLDDFTIIQWAVEESDDLIGACGLTWLEGWDRYELSFHFARRAWGRGIATEAARAAVAHGFETLPLQCLVAGTFGEHEPSHRVLTKTGFVPVGVKVWPDTDSL